VEIIEDKDKEQEQSMPDRHPEMERNLVYPSGRRKKRPSEKEAAQRPTRRGGVVRGEAMEAAAEDEAEDAEMSDQIGKSPSRISLWRWMLNDCNDHVVMMKKTINHGGECDRR
jgi:hypothetical protein